jgi:flagellar protein FlaF
MYQFPYAEIFEDPQTSRARERDALHHAVELLRLAEASGPESRAGVEALLFVQRLWTILLDDLALSDNSLPEGLRASLVSIGLRVMKEAEQIRLGASRNLKGLREINETIRDGLARAAGLERHGGGGVAPTLEGITRGGR